MAMRCKTESGVLLNSSGVIYPEIVLHVGKIGEGINVNRLAVMGARYFRIGGC
jgi:hypothetical protein